MNIDDDSVRDAGDGLQAGLDALPRQMTPPVDGWSRLQAALPPRAAGESVAAPGLRAGRQPLRSPRRRWAVMAGTALAASVALYWVAPSVLQPPGRAAAAPTLLQQQASVMTSEYQQAMAILPAADAPEWAPALQELDESVDQIREAMAQSPRSRHLLEQLQRTYALRLELTRQAAQSATGLPT